MSRPDPSTVPFRTHDATLLRFAVAGLTIVLGVLLWTGATRGRPAVHPALLPGGHALTLDAPHRAVHEAPVRLPATTPMTSSLALGRRLFEADWQGVPALAAAIGPESDATGCTACHAEARKLGIAATPAHRHATGGEPFRIVRLLDPDGIAPARQLTRHRGDSTSMSRQVVFGSSERAMVFGNGDTQSLRSISSSVNDGDTSYGADRLAVRIAPPLFGWGLLERVDAGTLARMADPFDRDGDGISGRLPLTRHGIGRFGWKAAQPTLAHQIAAALQGDMGVTTAHGAAPTCLIANTGVCEPELLGAAFDALVDYVGALSVPDRRVRHDERTRRGARLFSSTGCADCHVPAMVIAPERGEADDHEVLWPYSDLLLHDMGEALADPIARGRPAHAPSPSEPHRVGEPVHAAEWRTAPLWGLGLLEGRPGHRFLHDGRARTLLEAALWHGGEAEGARRRLEALPPDDRAALVAFLRSL